MAYCFNGTTDIQTAVLYIILGKWTRKWLVHVTQDSHHTVFWIEMFQICKKLREPVWRRGRIPPPWPCES
jgi:hypothetical protein